LVYFYYIIVQLNTVVHSVTIKDFNYIKNPYISITMYIFFFSFGFIMLLLIVLMFIYFYLPRIIVDIDNRLMAYVNKPNDHENSTPDDFNLIAERLSIFSKEGFNLKAYFVQSDDLARKGTVILLHGIRGSKESYLPSSAFLAHNGYNSLVIDIRAHGESQGDYCTFGQKEKMDISLWVDELQRKLGENHPIGIWGNSLGGAIAIQSLEYDSRLSFGIIESTFSDLKSTIHDYMGQNFGFNFPMLTDFLIGRAGDIAEFDVIKVRPRESMEHIKQAVLLVHGEEDKQIDISYAKANFKKLLSKRKRFLSIPKASHTNLWEVGGKEYFKQILGFINQQVVPVEIPAEINLEVSNRNKKGA